jgi:hypothetical protein
MATVPSFHCDDYGLQHPDVYYMNAIRQKPDSEIKDGLSLLPG